MATIDPSIFAVPTTMQINPDVCYNASQYLGLQNQITGACYTAEMIGLAVGLAFGVVIGYLIHVQVIKYGSIE